MAKKNRSLRRTPIKRVQTIRPEALGVAPDAPLVFGRSGSAANAEITAGQTTGPKKVLDFSEEYHYVISDLKRVGILAAALLMLLIVLSFVL